jgi:hypothetical protein
MTNEKIRVGSSSAFRWYFSQRFGNLLTVPLFVFLSSLFLVSLWVAFIKGFALIKVTWAVYGIVGIIALAAFGWVWVILVLGPPTIYLFLMTYPAVALSDFTVSRLRRVGNMIVVLLMAFLTIWALQFVGAWLTAWIADHDPCEAWQAGVTGSIPPTNCERQS